MVGIVLLSLAAKDFVGEASNLVRAPTSNAGDEMQNQYDALDEGILRSLSHGSTLCSGFVAARRYARQPTLSSDHLIKKRGPGLYK